MATQTWAGATFAGGTVTASLLFDDVTLLITAAQYTNSSPQAVAAHVVGPGVNQTFTWPANAGAGQSNLSGLGLHMVATQAPASHGFPARTVYNLPTGWSVEFQYPAS